MPLPLVSYSYSLPPIRSSRTDDGPLPGIASIIDQSKKHARCLSDTPLEATRAPRLRSRTAEWQVEITRSDVSLLEDRSRCTSPIQLPGFAQLDTLAHSSAFELSDLRTSLPSEDPRVRSPRSTPLPLSRPMSPAQPGGSPHIYPLTRRLKALMVSDQDKGPDPTFPRHDDLASPIKIEPAPSSPAAKGLDELDLPVGGLISRVPSLYLNTCSAEERDEHMSCTPTQTAPHRPWTKEVSPTTATGTAPPTPIMRQSPLMDPSPLMTPPSTPSSPPDSDLRSPPPVPDNDDQDSKLGIIKHSESETEDDLAVGAGARHKERRARRRAAHAGPIDQASVQARGMPYGFGPPGFIPMPMIPADPVTQLAQQAERLGFRLQPDLTRRSLSNVSSQLTIIHQMMQRQQHIEQLQREQQEAAVGIGMSSAWGPAPDLHIGALPMPDLAQPAMQSFSPSPAFPISLSAIPPEPLDDLIPSMMAPDASFDYGFVAPSPPFHSDFSTPSSSFSGLGMSGASGTSSSSPSSSFSFMSPPPPPLQPGPSSTTFAAELPGKDEASSGPSTGAGTHKCESCGKTFRRPSGLKDHMNIHSGEKPYCCPLDSCRKGFATRSNMIRHHNKTHPTRPKIGGVADINTDVDDGVDRDVGDADANLASSTGSLASLSGGTSSSQGRFRVVQQSKGGVPAGTSATVDGLGVGPVRGNKERRANRKQGLGQASAQVI